jgi:hypothetical protein
MKRFLIVVAALAVSATLSMMLTSVTNAYGSRGGGLGSRSGQAVRGGQIRTGGFSPSRVTPVRADSSRGRGYRGWTRYYWFPCYAWYGYCCSDDGCWYYWYGPGNCFRPVSDMAVYPPDNSIPPGLHPRCHAGALIVNRKAAGAVQEP